jgi:hypothetical protein
MMEGWKDEGREGGRMEVDGRMEGMENGWMEGWRRLEVWIDGRMD